MNKQIPDSLRIQALLSLAGPTYLMSHPDSAEFYANMGFELAEKSGTENEMADALRLVALALHLKGENEKSIEVHKRVIALREKLNDRAGLSKAYNNIAMSYKAIGDYTTAIQYSMSALKIYEELGNESGIASVLHNLGHFCFDQAYFSTQSGTKESDLLKAEEYFKRSMEIKLNLNDKRGFANTQTGLLMVYRTMEKFDEALQIATQILETAKSVGIDDLIATAHNNLGVVYQDLAFISKDEATKKEFYALALLQYERGLELRRQGGNLSDIANSLNNVAILQADLGNHKEAVKLSTEALELARQYKDVKEIRNISENLFKSYEAMAQYKEALDMYRVFIHMRDSINSQDAREELLKQEMQFGFEKEKLEEAAIYDRNLQKLKNLRNLSFAGGGMLMLITFIFINRSRLKQKAAKALELKNAEVEAARARAERSEAFRKQFLANMSHEIRTPMNAIIGLTRLLKDEPLQPHGRKYIDAIEHASGNLMVIINDILDLSKLEAGKMEAALHPADLRLELQQLATSFAQRCADKGLDFEVILQADLHAYVRTDMARVNQVLYNLLSNALKFTEKGKVTLRVGQELVANNKVRLQFTVEDTGTGIPIDKQNTIFESFGQAHSDDARRFGGTGLGLTIARSLVQMLGGEIAFTSREGEGSAFHFSIQCSFADKAAYDAYCNTHTFTISKLQAAYPIRILLADDNEYNRIVASDTITKYFPNAQITTVESGKEVLAALNTEKPDMILMDIQMPGMDGHECTRAIRNLDTELHSVPIIALTASVISTEIQRCYDAGMNGYVPKPFVDSDLLRPIVQIINTLAPREQAETAYATEVKAHDNKSLFLKLIPPRLEAMRKAIESQDVKEVKRIIHLMRPQLMTNGLSSLDSTLEWFEYIDHSNPDKEWMSKAKSVITKIEELL